MMYKLVTFAYLVAFCCVYYSDILICIVGTVRTGATYSPHIFDFETTSQSSFSSEEFSAENLLNLQCSKCR